MAVVATLTVCICKTHRTLLLKGWFFTVLNHILFFFSGVKRKESQTKMSARNSKCSRHSWEADDVSIRKGNITQASPQARARSVMGAQEHARSELLFVLHLLCCFFWLGWALWNQLLERRPLGELEKDKLWIDLWWEKNLHKAQSWVELERQALVSCTWTLPERGLSELFLKQQKNEAES